MKVYMVSEWQPDQWYDPRAIFSSRELAEAAAAKAGWDSVEEWELDPYMPEEGNRNGSR